MKAKPYEPVKFELANGRTIEVCLDEEKDEINVRLHGRRCGELSVIGRASNSVTLRSTGDGYPSDRS